eukprot:PhM_4_TR6416/c0_g1_i1/m.74293
MELSTTVRSYLTSDEVTPTAAIAQHLPAPTLRLVDAYCTLRLELEASMVPDAAAIAAITPTSLLKRLARLFEASRTSSSSSASSAATSTATTAPIPTNVLDLTYLGIHHDAEHFTALLDVMRWCPCSVVDMRCGNSMLSCDALAVRDIMAAAAKNGLVRRVHLPCTEAYLSLVPIADRAIADVVATSSSKLEQAEVNNNIIINSSAKQNNNTSDSARKRSRDREESGGGVRASGGSSSTPTKPPAESTDKQKWAVDIFKSLSIPLIDAKEAYSALERYSDELRRSGHETRSMDLLKALDIIHDNYDDVVRRFR